MNSNNIKIKFANQFTIENQAIVLDFLKEFKEYNNSSYQIRIESSTRFNMVFELIITKIKIGNLEDYIGRFGCFEDEKGYRFEKLINTHVNQIRACVNAIFESYVYYPKEENDEFLSEEEGDKLDDEILQDFQVKNERRIRKEIAEKILNGKIPISFFTSDWDTYEVPLSEVKQNHNYYKKRNH